MIPSVAVLYPHVPSLEPRREGREAGADIAYSLREAGVRVITRRDAPRAAEALDWVFADSVEGVRAARAAGAEALWLTFLPEDKHPALNCGARIVGQAPGMAAPREDSESEKDADFFLFPEGAEMRCFSVARRTENSVAVEKEQMARELARRLQIRAPIRCSGGPGLEGKYRLFNLDFNPSFAGGERRMPGPAVSPLIAAAAEHGITHAELATRLLRQAWLPNA